MTRSESGRFVRAVVDVLSSANEKLFEKIKDDDIMASALMELMKPEVDKKVKEERNMMAQIVSALMAGKDNDTIIKELNCTLDQTTPMRTAMGK